MDVFFSCPLTPEDLSGVLRTILLFLESLKLVKTCEILKSECRNSGFDISLESNEKAANSSSEESSANSVNANEPVFVVKTARKTTSEDAAVQYDDERHCSQSNAMEICNSAPPKNGSGESQSVFQCEKMWAFEEMLKKFKTLQVEHVKLMGITAELVKALQVGISGQSERFFHLREKCKAIYPDLFVLMQNNDELMMDSSKIRNEAEVFYLSAEKMHEKLEIKRSVSDTCLAGKKGSQLERKESSKSLENVIFENTKSVSTSEENNCEKASEEQLKNKDVPFEIDYGRIKSDLINADDGRKILILQALRWRITKQPVEIRQKVMATYIKHDLLCLQAPFREKPIFLESLYCPKTSGLPNPVQDSIARLVNTFASLSAGRDYLCQYDNLLTQLLLPLILNRHHTLTKLGNTTKDMLLATLQKLSLRFHARQKMITFGLTEFLINFLNEQHANISVYCLEYCTALMMNLCLHKEGRNRCTMKAREVIRLIKNLLNSKHAENIMPYVSGTMYSLLGNRKINSEAKLMDLASLLRYHIKLSAGDNKKQLEYVLKIHLEGGCIKHPDPKMEGEEMDLLEPELDENDPVRGEISGEEVLAHYKLQKNQEDPFRNIPTTPRPRSTSLTENSDKLLLKGPHPSKCTSIEETIKQEKVDSNGENTNAPIPPASPAESFSEVTKQFYHKPSKKRGIFDKKKLKFPKNPYQTKLTNIPSADIRINSDENPSDQTFTCNCGYRTCEYGHQNTNKYTCCCYEAMKAFIENTSGIKTRNDSSCQTSSITKTGAKNNDVVERINDSSGKLYNVKVGEGNCGSKTCALEEGENYCRCYNVIFQSRPRIIRTPPQ